MIRSKSYAATITSLQDEYLEDLREFVWRYNIYTRRHNPGAKTLRIRIRPRLGKNSEWASLYGVGGPLYAAICQEIRREHAQRFDIYLNAVTVQVKVK